MQETRANLALRNDGVIHHDDLIAHRQRITFS
jgi:hypothetical protein